MAKDLSSLPKPNSRIEEFLEYLAYNDGSGGNGGNTPSISEYIKNIEYNNSTKIMTVTKQDNSIFTVNFSGYAVNDIENIFSEINHFKDITVPHMVSNSHYGAETGVFRNRYVGIRSQSSDLFSDGYVEKIRVYINSELNGATEVSEIQVWSVTKKKSVSEEMATELIKDNITCEIITENDVSYIEIPINRKFNINTYFIYKLPLNPVGYRSIVNVNQSLGNDYINAEIAPSVGTAIVKGTDTFSIYSQIYGRKYLKNALTNADDKVRVIKTEKKVFEGERNNSFNAKYFRIPSMIRTKDDVILAFGDVRYNTGGDHSFIEIGCARSEDNGLTWDYKIAVNNENTNSTYSRVMDTTALVSNTNRVILLNGSWNDSNKWTSGTATPKVDWKAFISISDDNGLTWTRRDISSIKPANTVGFLGGVGTGIQMKEGQYAGRLIMPIQICLREGSTNVVRAGCIYSTDNGDTWTMSTSFTDVNNSENMIIEVNGNLIMSSRRDSSAGSRGAWISTDGGQTWAVYDELHGRFTHGTAQGSGCQGSWIKYVAKNGDIIGLLSHPKNANGNWTRDNITVYMYNFTRPSMGIVALGTPYPKAGNADGAGYSSMCYHKGKDGKETLEILFEDNGSLTFKDITYMLGYIDDICMSKGANVSLEGKNEFTGSIEFNKADTSITGNTTLLYQPNKLDDNYYMGYRGHIIEADTYISKVKIAIFSGFTGTTVSKLSVVATEISDSMANDKPYEVLVSEGASYEVKTGEGIYQKYIEVPINKKVRRRGYLLFKVNMGNSDTTRPLRTSRINEDNSEDPLSVHLRHDLVNIHDTNGRLSGTDVSTKKFIMVYEAFGLNINVEKTLINLVTGEYNLGGGISPTSLSLEISDNSLKLKNGNDVISSINFATLEEIDTIVDNIQF